MFLEYGRTGKEEPWILWRLLSLSASPGSLAVVGGSSLGSCGAVNCGSTLCGQSNIGSRSLIEQWMIERYQFDTAAAEMKPKPTESLFNFRSSSGSECLKENSP